MDNLDNLIVEMSLDMMQECSTVDTDSPPNLIDFCLNLSCPEKTLTCLQLIKKLNGDNPQYQNVIDRYIDDLSGNYEPSGEK